MIWNVVWLVAAITMTSTSAYAACGYGPEEAIQCDTPQEHGFYLQKKAEEAKAQEAERQRAGQEREQAYCAANPNSTDCRDTNWAPNNGGLQCPAGQVSTGGPATSAMCVADTSNIPVPEPRPRGAGAPTGAAAPSGQARAENQDNLVSAAADQEATRCKQAAESAVSTCDSAMNSIRSLSSQVSQKSGAISQGGASGCAQMGQTANNAGNQMQSQRNSCQSAVTNCNSTCDSALSNLAHAPSSGASVRASQARARCQSASASMSTMDLNINQVRTAANQANQCYQQATGSSIPGLGGSADTPSLAAAASPVLDCSNPQVAQNNPVCICRDNPGHSMCGSSTASSDYVSTSRAIKPDSPAGISRNTNVGTLDSEQDAGLPSGYVPSRTGRFAQQAGGVGQIGGAGAGGNLPTPAHFKGARPSRYDPNVLKGAQGSNGAGPRVGGGGYAEAGAGSAGATTARGARAAGQPRGQAVDLRRFLPQDGRSAQRGLASEGNGIGLRHTNIWTTVSGRYNRVSESLDP